MVATGVVSAAMTSIPRPVNVQRGNPWSEKRTAKGLSLRELETLTGIHRGTLSRIERGLAPSPEQAAKLLLALQDAAA